MSPLGYLPQLTNAVTALSGLLRQIAVLMPLLSQIRPRQVLPAYENLRLDLVLDIQDEHGRRAVLTRRQRIRLRSGGDIVVRDLVWGDGAPLARYWVAGARRLSVQPEGSRRTVLLRMAQPATRGSVQTLQSRRLIKDGLRERTEYCEALVERPTGRLTMKVLFPDARPPRDAHLVTSPQRAPSRQLRVRYGPEGRPYLAWRTTAPIQDTVYSLRWRW